MTDKKLTFRKTDSGCTEKDYRARFTSTNGFVTVTAKWTPDKSYYRVYPVIADIDGNLWASPAICVDREFEGVKTPMDLEALIIERMKGASISGDANNFTINWNGIPAFNIQTLGHKSVHTIATLYNNLTKEFVLDDRTIRTDGNMRTGTIVDYNPCNPNPLKVIRVNDTTLIGSIIETE